MYKVIEDLSDEELLSLEQDIIEDGILLKIDVPDKDIIKDGTLSNKEILYNVIITNLYYNTQYANDPEIQCTSGRRRSLGDLFMIMKYYCPNITLKEVRSYLFELINNQELITVKCDTINKRVYFRHSIDKVWVQELKEYIYSETKRDEYGYKLKII